jgi:hypothetical protein
MKIQYARLLSRLLILLAILVLPHLRAEAQTSSAAIRITQAVDEKNLVTLKGNVHPLARAEFDQGAVSDGQPLHRMLLLLQRSADQEASLEKLLDDQQNKSSANYHAWLTPAQFGQQFGPADADIQTVTNWLQSHGFQITNVSAGRTVIEFSGNAAQVRTAFHAEIHKYVVNGETHMANASDPQIPAALAPVVAGPVSLNNFPVKSHIRQLGTFQKSLKTGETKPLFTFPGNIPCQNGNCYAMGPADFATIYNTQPLLNGTPKIDGTGQTIAIVGESDIDIQDVINFRAMFGLPQNFSNSNILLNGPDPGFNGSEGESDLDVQWAGAVAPGATIDFVVSGSTETTSGIFLSATYIVENNLAGVMSESFGGCEQHIGTLNQFHNLLWEQAAAQGITVMLSAGDGGSAGCDNFDTEQTASDGLAVSGFASTPFNVAVGGTDFDDAGTQSTYWNTTPTSIAPPVPSSALSYIPEVPWNDSCARNGLSGCTAENALNIVAGSGGASTLYGKPSWQTGSGVPNDQHRDLPDVSLFASIGSASDSFYIMCQSDALPAPGTACNLTNFEFTFQGVGGTSASSPAFAGIMALVNQKFGRQGNANYVLYALAKKSAASCNANSGTLPASTCIFYDVTKGNNSVPCGGGSLNCSSPVAGAVGILVPSANPSTPAYSAGAGYDLATGLGSVNAKNLVNNWSSVSFSPSVTTLSATVNGKSAASITGLTHGQTVGVAATVAAGSGGSGTPTGQVSLFATPNPTANPGGAYGFDVLSLTAGAASSSSVILPGGNYNLTAHYQGDGTFGASDSPGISVTVAPEPSKTLVSIPVFDPSTGAETGNQPTSLVYGSPYIARVDVGNAALSLTFPAQPPCSPPACPSGKITWTDAVNGGAPAPLDAGTLVLNADGYTEDQTIQLSAGTHVLTASYGGDGSYQASTGTYSLTVTQVATTTTLTASTTNAVVFNQFGLTADVKTNGYGAAPSCNAIVFKDGSTVLNLGGDCIQTAGSANGPAETVFAAGVLPTAPGVHSYTATYIGEPGYSSSVSNVQTVTVKLGTTLSVQVVPPQILLGQSTTLTALVDTGNRSPTPGPTGTVTFTGANTGQVNNPVICTAATDASGNEACQASVTYSPTSSETVTATYSGDTNYAANNFSPPTVVVVIQPTFSVSETPITLTAGSSGTSTITVTPTGPLTGNVIVTASALPPGVTCPSSPLTINVNGTTTSGTFNCQVVAPSMSLSAANLSQNQTLEANTAPLRKDDEARDKGWWTLSASTGFAAVFLLFLPGRKRYRTALRLGLVCLISFSLGCGGGGGGSIIGGGPTPTVTQMTVNADKVGSGTAFTFTVAVTGGNPGGSVELMDNGVLIGTAATVSGGKATPTAPALSVGTHSISAQYLGDANTQASQSGALNLTVTGITTLIIITNPPATPAAPALTITIN